MALKNILAVLLCTAMLAWSGASAADEYRPEEFLKLDLSRAVLSPKRLGPPTYFEPVAVEAKADPKIDPAQRAGAEAETKTVSAPPVTAAKADPAQPAAVEAKANPAVKVMPVRAAKRHPAVRTKLARKHTNSLDAQAFDTRIQVWPCKSGGICDWQR
jgi:hypothetical protein